MDLPNPILNTDFLDHSNLLVDVRRQKLVDNSTSLSAPARSTTNALFSPKFFIASAGNQFHTLLSFYPDLVDPTFNSSPKIFIASAGNQFHTLLSFYPDLVDPTFNSTKVVHSTVHHITTTGPPVFSRPRRLVPDRPRKAKAEFDHILQFGLIRTSISPWASSLHLVRKSVVGDSPMTKIMDLPNVYINQDPSW